MTNEELTTKKTCSWFWKGFALFLLGVILGFVFAPIKKGVMIGSNNWARECGNGNSADLPDCDDITSEDAEDSEE